MVSTRQQNRQQEIRDRQARNEKVREQRRERKRVANMTESEREAYQRQQERDTIFQAYRDADAAAEAEGRDIVGGFTVRIDKKSGEGSIKYKSGGKDYRGKSAQRAREQGEILQQGRDDPIDITPASKQSKQPAKKQPIGTVIGRTGQGTVLVQGKESIEEKSERMFPSALGVEVKKTPSAAGFTRSYDAEGRLVESSYDTDAAIRQLEPFINAKGDQVIGASYDNEFGEVRSLPASYFERPQSQYGGGAQALVSFDLEKDELAEKARTQVYFEAFGNIKAKGGEISTQAIDAEFERLIVGKYAQGVPIVDKAGLSDSINAFYNENYSSEAFALSEKQRQIEIAKQDQAIKAEMAELGYSVAKMSVDAEGNRNYVFLPFTGADVYEYYNDPANPFDVKKRKVEPQVITVQEVQRPASDDPVSGFVNYFTNLPKGFAKAGQEIAYGKSDITVDPEAEGQLLDTAIENVKGFTEGGETVKVRTRAGYIDVPASNVARNEELAATFAAYPSYYAGSAIASGVFTFGTLGIGPLAKAGMTTFKIIPRLAPTAKALKLISGEPVQALKYSKQGQEQLLRQYSFGPLTLYTQIKDVRVPTLVQRARAAIVGSTSPSMAERNLAYGYSFKPGMVKVRVERVTLPTRLEAGAFSANLAGKEGRITTTLGPLAKEEKAAAVGQEFVAASSKKLNVKVASEDASTIKFSETAKAGTATPEPLRNVFKYERVIRTNPGLFGGIAGFSVPSTASKAGRSAFIRAAEQEEIGLDIAEQVRNVKRSPYELTASGLTTVEQKQKMVKSTSVTAAERAEIEAAPEFFEKSTKTTQIATSVMPEMPIFRASPKTFTYPRSARLDLPAVKSARATTTGTASRAFDVAAETKQERVYRLRGPFKDALGEVKGKLSPATAEVANVLEFKPKEVLQVAAAQEKRAKQTKAAKEAMQDAGLQAKSSKPFEFTVKAAEPFKKTGKGALDSALAFSFDSSLQAVGRGSDVSRAVNVAAESGTVARDIGFKGGAGIYSVKAGSLGLGGATGAEKKRREYEELSIIAEPTPKSSSKPTIRETTLSLSLQNILGGSAGKQALKLLGGTEQKGGVRQGALQKISGKLKISPLSGSRLKDATILREGQLFKVSLDTVQRPITDTVTTTIRVPKTPPPPPIETTIRLTPVITFPDTGGKKKRKREGRITGFTKLRKLAVKNPFAKGFNLKGAKV